MLSHPYQSTTYTMKILTSLQICPLHDMYFLRESFFIKISVSIMSANEKSLTKPKLVCNNAYFHRTHSAVPDSLSFAPQALFFALEAIVCHPAPNSSMTQSLRKMLVALEQHDMYGYFRLKAYIYYHSDIVQKVRRVQRSKGCSSCDRYSAGMRLLLDGITFRDLAKAYFEVAEEVEKNVRKRKRKDIVMEKEKAYFEVAEKGEEYVGEQKSKCIMTEKEKM